jgi:hypothetical protein
MLYNDDHGMYNENTYNSNDTFLDLIDAIAWADSEQPYPQIVRSELITLVDTIGKLLNNDPWFDDIVPMESVATFLLSKPLAGELLTVSDVLDIIPNKVPVETISLIETLVVEFNTAYADFILLTDLLTKQVTSKGLLDSVRTNDWLSLEKLFVEKWGD